jgi:hypothetical protein
MRCNVCYNFKAIPFPTLESLNPFRDELIGEWSNMLAHQLPALPPIQSFLDALPEFFAWLTEERAPVVLAVHPMARNTEVLRGPAGAFGGFVSHRPFIETIRFAASNRLCVELDYRDEQGNRDTRLIEAYSLRRSQAGDILLMASRADSGAPRSYRLDRILGARTTERSFIPRYPIELTPSGPPSIPETERGPRDSSGTSSWGFGSPAVRTRRAPVRRPATGGPKYIFRCMVCGREFERTSYDGALRSHKNKSGIDCYGTTGFYVRTKY